MPFARRLQDLESEVLRLKEDIAALMQIQGGLKTGLSEASRLAMRSDMRLDDVFEALDEHDKLLAPAPDDSDIPDRLFEAMALVGRRQVTFAEAGKLLRVTRQRVHQAKRDIAADTRFELSRSGSHKQRLLIRLKEVKMSDCQI